MIVDISEQGIWFDKPAYDEAEEQYYSKASGTVVKEQLGSVASQIAKVRQDIQNSLTSGTSSNVSSNQSTEITALTKLVKSMELTIATMNKKITDLTKTVGALSLKAPTATPTAAPVAAATQEEEDDDDEVDLFGSDEEEEDAEADRIRQERLKAYAEKKSKKPGPIAKSSVVLDCKPWDDETDMKAMEDLIRTIEMDGLRWGAGELKPLAYGIKKLSIICIIEDEKVSVEDLSDQIKEFEDFVQSVDVFAFNKI